MKKLFTILLLICAVSAFGQSDIPASYIRYLYTYGVRYDRGWFDRAIHVPRDTIYTKSGLAIISSTLYYGDSTRWWAVGSGGAGSLTSLGGGIDVGNTGTNNTNSLAAGYGQTISGPTTNLITLQPDTAILFAAIRATIPAGGGSTLTSQGASYPIGVTGTNNTKSIRDSLYWVLDSTIAGTLRGRVDTATLFPAVRTTIPAGGTSGILANSLVNNTFDSLAARSVEGYFPSSFLNLGTSIENGLGSTPDSIYGKRFAVDHGMTFIQGAADGRGVVQAMINMVANMGVGANTVTSFAGYYNDARRGGNGMLTRRKYMDATQVAFAYQNMKSYNIGTSSLITRNGSNWNPGYNSDLFGGRTSNGAYTGTVNDSLNYSFTDSTVFIIFTSGDGVTQIHSNSVEIYIDGVLNRTISTNQRTDGLSDGNLDNARSTMAVIIRGLTYAVHLLTVKNKNANTMGVDGIGHLLDYRNANPIFFCSPNKMDATGYAISPSNATDAVMDTFKVKIDSVITNICYGYPVYNIDPNPYFVPTTSGDLQGDHIHILDIGQRHIYQAMLDVSPPVGELPAEGTIFRNREHLRIVQGDSLAILDNDLGATTQPGGSNQQLQRNNSGEFGAVAGATSDGTNLFVPTLYGSSTSAGNLTLSSTTNATKGHVRMGTLDYDETNNFLGLNMTPGTSRLDITNSGTTTHSLIRTTGMASQSGDHFLARNSASVAVFRVDATGGIQVLGPLSGPVGAGGFELEYNSGTAYITAYNRSGSAWLPITIRGSTMTFQNGGSTSLSVNGSGVWNLPLLSASLPLKLNGSKDITSAAIDLASAEVTGILPAAKVADLSATYELVSNKSTNTSLGTSNTLYPTQNAVKTYVDNTGSLQFPKAASDYATTAALAANTYNNGASGVGATITMNATGTVTIDGHVTALNENILIKDEATQANNGIYTVTTAGAVGVTGIFTRRADYDQGAETVAGSNTFIINGTANAGQVYTQSTAGTITMGTTALNFVRTGGNIATAWGSITGTLSSQTDLQSALDAKQPLDGDLTTISGLTATTDNFMIGASSAWASRTPAQAKTSLSLNNVENTALSTWAGTSNITAVGTLASGAVPVTLLTGTTLPASVTSSSLTSFGSSPSFTTPNINAATGTSLVLSSFLNEAKGADIASATTTNIGAATGNYVDVTGTTTITGFGTVQAGTRRIVKFTGALTLTNNATSLILPGSQNITTVAGDIATFVSLGAGNWQCVNYSPVSTQGSGSTVFATAPTLTTPNFTTGFKIAGGASSGKIPIGDGTNFVASTPTYPNAASTSGKVIKSDGTNLVMSTETYAVPGTSGNIMQSDGTNWISAPNANSGEGSITAATAGIANTETKIVSSDAAMAANRLVAGTTIQVTLHGTTTSTAAGVGIIRVRYGTAATVADGIMQTFTLSAAPTTGTAIPFMITAVITLRAAGAAVASDGGLQLVNSGTTGLSATETQVKRGTSTNINTTTASTFFTVSYISGNAATTTTFQDAVITILNK